MKQIIGSILTLLLLSACGSGSDSGGDVPTSRYTVSGQVTGLLGEIIVDINGTMEVITDNGEFTLETQINDGEAFLLTFVSSDQGLNCEIVNGSGSSEANVTDVEINCDGTQGTAYSLNGLAFNVESPSVVTFAFHLIDRYSKLAVNDITTENIESYVEVLENDLAISSTESFLEISQFKNFNSEYHTVYAINTSISLTNSELTDIVNEIRNTIVDSQSGQSLLAANQHVSIITFDGNVKQIVTDTQDTSEIIEGLDDIIEPQNLASRGNSTNLHGALETGASLWQNEISLEKLSYGNLVVFTNAPDTSSKVTQTQALTALEGKDVYIISTDSNTDTSLLTPFTHEQNIFQMDNLAQLSTALDSTLTQMTSYEDGLYILSYATPKRSGNHTMTVSAVDDYRCDTAVTNAEIEELNNNGEISDCFDSHSHDFSAASFTDVTPQLSISGVKNTLATEVTWSPKLRWSRETPNYDWDVNVCTGSIAETRSSSNSDITFERRNDGLAVAEITLRELNTLTSDSAYLIMADNGESQEFLTQSQIRFVCGN